MTFRERVSQGNSQSQARNSVCALAAIVDVIPDALRRSCTRNGQGKAWRGGGENMGMVARREGKKVEGGPQRIFTNEQQIEWLRGHPIVNLCAEESFLIGLKMHQVSLYCLRIGREQLCRECG